MSDLGSAIGQSAADARGRVERALILARVYRDLRLGLWLSHSDARYVIDKQVRPRMKEGR